MHSDTAVSPSGHPPLPRFGEFELDLQARELNRDGRRIRLQEQPFQVLVMLLGRAGQVVTREELRQKLWPSSVYVDFDHGLNNAIGRLRETLGDVAATPRFIETLPRLGYRFIAPITHSRAPARTHADAVTIASLAEADAAVPSLSARKPLWRRRGGIAAAAIVVLAITAMLRIDPLRLTGPADETLPATAGVKVKSIAVLPFLDMSAGQDQGYLADGFAEEILNRLAQSENLRVISRTSSFAFRGKSLDIRDIAAQLSVSHVLEGSIRRAGDKIRITAQLIAASDNAHVWSRTFDRTSGDLFALQDEIAAAVATALRVTLEDSRQTGEAPVRPEAYEPYLQGRFFFNRRAPGDIELSVKYCQDALAIDPGFARAWAALAGAYNLQRARDRTAPERWLQLQGEAARKAVELAPGLAVAHARLAQYYYITADRQNGDAHFQTAMALDPDEPLVMGFAGDRAIMRGDLDGAVEIWRQLVDRNPLSPIDRGNLAHFLAAAGHLDEAVAESRRALELNPDAHWSERFDLARILVRQERFDDAVAEIMRLPMGEPRDSGMAILHEVPGYEAEADAALQRLAALPLDLESIRLAELYAACGMTEQAFASLQAVRDALKRSADSPRWAIAQTSELQMDMIESSYLEPLRSDPRWAELIADPLRR